MARGVRKRRQVQYKVWFSNGSSISETTTKDLTEEEFADQLRRTAAMFLRYAEHRPTPAPKPGEPLP